MAQQPPPETPIPQQPQPPAQTDSSAPAAPKAKEEPNLLVHIIESAGWFFGPLLFLVSIGLVTLIVLLAMDLRMSVAVPPGCLLPCVYRICISSMAASLCRLPSSRRPATLART